MEAACDVRILRWLVATRAEAAIDNSLPVLRVLQGVQILAKAETLSVTSTNLVDALAIVVSKHGSSMSYLA